MNTKFKNNKKNVSRVRIMGGSNNKKIGLIVIGLMLLFLGTTTMGIEHATSNHHGTYACSIRPPLFVRKRYDEHSICRTEGWERIKLLSIIYMSFWSYSKMYFKTNYILLSYQALLDNIYACLRNMCTCFRFTTKKLKIEIADLPSAVSWVLHAYYSMKLLSSGP